MSYKANRGSQILAQARSIRSGAVWSHQSQYASSSSSTLASTSSGRRFASGAYGDRASQQSQTPPSNTNIPNAHSNAGASFLDEQEAKIAAIKEDQEKIMRNPQMRGIDLTKSRKDNLRVLNPLTPTPWSTSWFTSPKVYSWLRWRNLRWKHDRRHLQLLEQKGIFNIDRAQHETEQRFSRAALMNFWRRYTPVSWDYQSDWNDMYQIWQRLNEAQASGDVNTVRRYSCHNALKAAERIVSSGRKMQWKVTKENKPPQFLWARMVPIDMEGKLGVGQICLRFDSDQTLTFKPVLKSAHGSRQTFGPEQTRTQRVVDNVVFEALIPMRGPGRKSIAWQVKDRVETVPPHYTMPAEEWRKLEDQLGIVDEMTATFTPRLAPVPENNSVEGPKTENK